MSVRVKWTLVFKDMADYVDYKSTVKALKLIGYDLNRYLVSEEIEYKEGKN